MNEAEYTAIQNELQRGISLNDSFVLDEVRTVAGVDLANWQEGGEVYGRTLRTHKGVRPVFVSVGNHVSLDTACELALRLTDKESHIHVPTRLADLETHIQREQLKAAESEQHEPAGQNS